MLARDLTYWHRFLLLGICGSWNTSKDFFLMKHYLKATVCLKSLSHHYEIGGPLSDTSHRMDGKPQVTFPFFKIKCGTSWGYKVSTLWHVILLLGCDLWAGEHWHTLWISLWANLWITQTLVSRYHNTMAFAHESIFCAK